MSNFPEGDPIPDPELEDVFFDPADPEAEAVLVNFFPILQLLEGVELPPMLLKGAKGHIEKAKYIGYLIARSEDPQGDCDQALGAFSIEEMFSKHGNRQQFYNNLKPAFTFKVDQPEQFMEDLFKKPETRRRQWETNGNYWSVSRDIEPYEHRALSGFGIRMIADPETYRSTLDFHVGLRESGFANSVSALLKLSKMKRAVTLFPFTDDEKPRVYQPDEGGTGIYHQFDDGGFVKVEIDGRGIRLRSDFTPKFTEEATDQEKLDFLNSSVNSQLELASEKIPRFLQELVHLWPNQLPVYELKPRINTPEKESEWLKDIKENDRDYQEVPEILKDPRHRQIYLDTVRPKPETSFAMVGGLDKEVLQMRRAIRKTVSPEVYKQVGLTPKATILLAGPPGCGKTMLAEAAANEVGDIYLSAQGSDLMSMWAGEAEKNVAAFFEVIELLGREHKVVALLDEIENLAPSRTGTHMMEYERKITAEFLAALNRNYHNSILIAATNDTTHVDPAVIRSQRFNAIIKIPLPDAGGRVEIFNNWMSFFRKGAAIDVFEDPIDVAELARISQNFSGSDIQTIIEAALETITDEAIEGEREIRPVSQAQLVEAIKEQRKQSEVRATGQYI